MTVAGFFRSFTSFTSFISLTSDSREKMANAKLIFIGEVTQVAGVAAFVAGVVLSLHHWPAAAALIGGGAAFYVGKKLRAQ